MKHDTETYQFSCTAKARTARALLVYEHVADKEIWFPLSQVVELHGNVPGEVDLVVTAWIAKKAGLI